jgi:two-component system sensor kinase FixL
MSLRTGSTKSRPRDPYSKRASRRQVSEPGAAHQQLSDEIHELRRELLEVVEREQRRIAQDLHDDLCQYLSSMAWMLDGLAASLESVPTRKQVDRIRALVNAATSRVRGTIQGLDPEAVAGKGLGAALRELASWVTRTFQVECVCRCEYRLPRSPQVSLHLYRIAQEATHNAIRHGGAQHIVICVNATPKYVRLVVQDDGVGLPREGPRPGLGLRIMEHRAKTIGARLAVRRGRSRGSIVACTLPKTSLETPYAKTTGAQQRA